MLIMFESRRVIIKTIYILLSFVFLLCALIGVFLPVWPTTPFLLLSSILAAKGSARFHSFIINTKLYKKHLEDFVEHRSMSLASKVKILTLATILLMFGFYFSKVLWARILILILIIAKYYYFIFMIKTENKEKLIYD